MFINILARPTTHTHQPDCSLLPTQCQLYSIVNEMVAATLIFQGMHYIWYFRKLQAAQFFHRNIDSNNSWDISIKITDYVGFALFYMCFVYSYTLREHFFYMFVY